MKATDKSTETPTPSGISRRTVVKGAAWAVPVIAVAGSVPAMAASPCVEFTIGPNSCKLAGAFEYRINLCFSSTCLGNVFPIFVSRIETGNGRVLTVQAWDGQTPGATPVTAEYTTSGPQCIFLIGNAHSNPSSLVIYFSLAGVDQTPYVVDARPIQGGCDATTTTTTAAVTTTTTTAPVETTTTTAPVETTTTTAPVETITTTTAA